MTEPTDSDEPLVDELRALFARVDPVPAVVVQTGKAALGWRRLEADFAELLSDSAVDVEAAALARGIEVPIRSVTFTDGIVTIDLEIHHHDGESILLGQLSPASPAAIEVQRADAATIASAQADPFGRFRLTLAGGGTIRLLVTRDAPGAAIVETAWIAV
jgi:hypothetical protein